ncbi:hypothetical protein F503_03488 [Ophiostoma piceae UAMH 11346]|uniref:Uncharacterized protein n=1 Tax=Ophiostoma piceae (strain UAMH 11346) TaxID=1262450 RepID=S3C5D6_OPHP1|nr:hypothetical protein F503_03488 [Ophiostoma piceae UAMH 11346]
MYFECLELLRVSEEDMTSELQDIMQWPCIQDAAEASCLLLLFSDDTSVDGAADPSLDSHSLSDFEQAREVFMAFYAKWVRRESEHLAYSSDDRIYGAIMVSFYDFIGPLLFYLDRYLQMADSHSDPALQGQS